MLEQNRLTYGFISRIRPLYINAVCCCDTSEFCIMHCRHCSSVWHYSLGQTFNVMTNLKSFQQLSVVQLVNWYVICESQAGLDY
jgi:hypothetical protein